MLQFGPGRRQIKNMTKTLAERAEEARIILETERKAAKEEWELKKAANAIEYFKIHLPEAEYSGNGQFKFDGQLFDWGERYSFTRMLDVYELGDYKFGKFSNLGEYGAYLKRKSEWNDAMGKSKPKRPPNKIEGDEIPFLSTFDFIHKLFSTK